MLGSQAQTRPKDTSHSSDEEHKKKNQAKARYFLTWRWHFYAGLFVIPFMIMLSLTGLVMLFDDEIEQIRYHEITQVEPKPIALPVSALIESVSKAYPNGTTTQYIAPSDVDQASRVSVRLESGNTVFATVDPYTGKVLGQIDRSDSWYQLANDIHGTLLIGKWGDYLIEISASLGILLLVSGIYLWLPRDNASKAGFLKIRSNNGMRIFMRDIHANLGGTLSIVLLLFLLSGLAWAGVWGAKMVQGWNTFPTYYTWGDKPESSMTHADLNHGSEEEMPWNLEHADVPQSHHGHHSDAHSDTAYDASKTVSVDLVINKAKALGFTQYRVFLPQSKTGVFTVAANSMAGDIIDPRQDRTTHFDQYSGDVLVDVSWNDYSVVAKLMAAGVSLHQGDISPINKWLNALFCVAFIAISVTGALMWWKRRPAKQNKLGVPMRFEQEGIWKVGICTLFAVCLLFPLAGLSIVAVLLLDTLMIRRSKRLTAYLS